MRTTKIMGILNVTPDSFSDGGRFDHEDIVQVAGQMIADGAEILDVGGEASGPGSVAVDLQEEMARVIPAISKLRAAFPDILISIDTWKSEVAEAAIEAGANIINDIMAGRGDERIAEVAAKHQVPYIMMYSKDPSARTSTDQTDYEDVMETIKDFLLKRIEWASAKGVKEIWIDPGMGSFVSGNPEYSFEVMDRIEELNVLNRPILVGASRKGFLGEDRDGATIATSLWLKGKVDWLRVHQVLENVTATA